MLETDIDVADHDGSRLHTDLERATCMMYGGEPYSERQKANRC